MQEQILKNKFRTKARGRRQYHPDERREFLTAFQKSGLSMAAFARQQGINLKTFSNWLGNQRRSTNTSLKASPEFLQLTLPGKPSISCLTIRYKGVLDIQVAHESQVEWAGRLIEYMEKVSC